MIRRTKSAYVCLLTGTLALLISCQGTPELGTGKSVVTGSAGEAGAQETAVELAHCAKPLGMASLMEPSRDAMLFLTNNLNLQSPIPLLRLIMAQSNCFQVVDLEAVADPSTAARVHYMIRPNIIFSDQTGGYGGLGGLGGVFGWPGAILGAALGSIKIQEAQTVLFLNDAKTGLQTAAAEGSASVKDFGGVGGLAGFGSGVGGLGGLGGYGDTPEGKLLAAAFFDAYNKLVAQIGGGSVRPGGAS
jgi:hypothetical protein